MRTIRGADGVLRGGELRKSLTRSGFASTFYRDASFPPELREAGGSSSLPFPRRAPLARLMAEAPDPSGINHHEAYGPGSTPEAGGLACSGVDGNLLRRD